MSEPFSSSFHHFHLGSGWLLNGGRQTFPPQPPPRTTGLPSLALGLVGLRIEQTFFRWEEAPASSLNRRAGGMAPEPPDGYIEIFDITRLLGFRLGAELRDLTGLAA